MFPPGITFLIKLPTLERIYLLSTLLSYQVCLKLENKKIGEGKKKLEKNNVSRLMLCEIMGVSPVDRSLPFLNGDDEISRA